MKLPKHYDAKKVEPDIYTIWEKGNYFKPSGTGKSFSVVIPPPNITGSLHMGHALNNTMQDILVRRARMQGMNTLWVPGTDHAGIAAQNVVEKQLRKEKLSRHDLGREKFIERVWKWKDESGSTIIKQLKMLGCSCDWSHERFTMDNDYTEAVLKAFKQYKKKGYIYQGTRVINWCPRCQTAISDLENVHVEENGQLWHIRYPVVMDNKRLELTKKNIGYITVSTTRPETMFGDTAIAVNPKDPKYKKFINNKAGKTFVQIPLAKRNIPIVADRLVDMKFGTGAVKVTPAHDLTDEAIGKNQKLKTIPVINQYGKMESTEYVPEKYQNLKINVARKLIVSDLQDEEFITKTENHLHAVGHCERCNHVTEYLPSKQWFVRMNKLAKPAIKAVKDGKITFYPSRWKKVYINWLENIRDWCISRQLWWGHQIPIEGETDVLDTWFSSALWPFAVLGWPKKTKDLETFYPTTVLSTARDIIYLWVARMVFSSLEFTGKIPFHEVYIHPTVFNKEGKRMSKSLGTGIDPLLLMDRYGTDATRFGLAYQNTGTQDIKFSEESILAGKKFANKLWNASKFVMMNLDSKQQLDNMTIKQIDILSNTPSDKLILKQLSDTIKNVDKFIDKYEFGQAAHTLYDFFWHDFCDIYLEVSKTQLEDKKINKNTQKILFYVLKNSLKLLHPFMPFITEYIFQILRTNLKLTNKSLMISSWPSFNK